LNRHLRLIGVLIVIVATIAACADDASLGSTTEVAATLKDGSITLDRQEIPSGRVSFEISNEGTLLHEFEVFVGTAADLEIVKNVADTSGMDLVEEVEDIAPGTSITLDVDLDPGNYVIICNLPGHVAMGMVTELTVTG
jgi:uncharacterized cupredoxin-like copper-binding protein